MTNKDLSAKSLWEMHPHEVRDQLNQKILSVEADASPVFSVTNLLAEHGGLKIPLRIYAPSANKNLPVILLIHGGAWVAGNLDTHDNLSRYLCKEVQAVVVSVGYLNAPEGKFPFPLEQCYSALLWACSQAKKWHLDTTRIAIVGDSAGGNITAALCQLCKDRSGPPIRLQVLINPALDLTCNGTLKPLGDPWDVLRWYAIQYVDRAEDVHHPYVSPILAKNLKNLPPALILLAEHDPLKEEGQRYADLLSSFGVPTKVHVQLGIGHLSGDGARASIKARESLEVAVDSLREAFLR